MGMILELEDFSSFINEVGDKDVVRIAELRDKKETKETIRAVFTLKKPDHVVRLIQDAALDSALETYEADKKRIADALNEKRTAILSKNASFTPGMWII